MTWVRISVWTITLQQNRFITNHLSWRHYYANFYKPFTLKWPFKIKRLIFIIDLNICVAFSFTDILESLSTDHFVYFYKRETRLYISYVLMFWQWCFCIIKQELQQTEIREIKIEKVNLSPSDLRTSSADSLLKRNYLLGTQPLVKDTGNSGRYSPSSVTVKLPSKTKSYFQS